MPKIRLDLDQIDRDIMAGLKDFQRATVCHLDELYRSGQKRLLVCDEVGLGKTLVARGMVAKIAKLRQEEGDSLCKVVYICSNASIAGQNLRKLRISPDLRVESAGSSRLSMQHLQIFLQEHDSELLQDFVQLIPLTPDTSFRLTSGTGRVEERALMYAILRRLPALQPHLKALEVAMIDYAQNAWQGWAKNYWEEQVVSCNKRTMDQYIPYMLAKVSTKIKTKRNGTDLLSLLTQHLEQIAQGGFKRIKGTDIIGQLRFMFAKISVDLLKPDFVIMDEFQRFRFLIRSDEETETGLLAKRFFAGEHVRMLLLSATPYKLYSTLEEIDELSADEHYKEFFEVMDFLGNCEQGKVEFHEVWRDYSMQLRSFSQGNNSILQAKRKAEDTLFSVMARTERISAGHSGDIIDDSGARSMLNPTEADIKSYLDMQGLLSKINIKTRLPVDYVKSSPYLLSFMRQYQVKREVEKYFQDHPKDVKKADGKFLWVKRNQINRFQKLDPANARLQHLQELAFAQNAEKLLWVPPSLPYYELTGPFKGTEGFSKILAFSSWEMVPRMLSTMLSYESERKNARTLAGRSTQDAREMRYFPSQSGQRRYPAARLNFSLSQGEPRGMALFCLIYPAQSLATCFDPVVTLNQRPSRTKLLTEVETKIEELLQKLDQYQSESLREDDRWYYLAPLLLDDRDYVENWLSQGQSLAEFDDLENDQATRAKGRGQSGFLTHLDHLAQLVRDQDLKLGKKPKDLLAVLTNMALASPAICALRTYTSLEKKDFGSQLPSQLGKIFINRMNTPESTAVIEVCYGKSSDDAHWKNLLAYCNAGNLQAVFDEYAHILLESNGLAQAEDIVPSLHNLILKSMNVHTASYRVDTFNDFQRRIEGKKDKPMNIRTHFAVAFTKSDGDIKKGEDRREAVRNSFNSPFRPFVLATTSIGQEGLDFHYYCRKIVHWNLPANPIDIEQREGRINRYKCLAIRQNVARRYQHISFTQNIWYELFATAHKAEKTAIESDLVPFWTLAPSQDMIKIERIVPMYAFSRDVSAYERLIKILSLYRLTLGQPRQEELLEHLFSTHDEKELRDLFLNLSPFYKNSAKTMVEEDAQILSAATFSPE